MAALLLIACERDPEPAVLPEGLVLAPVAFGDLPGWSEDRVSEALPAVKRSCTPLLKRAAGESVGPGQLAGTVADWRPACLAALDLEDGDETGFRDLLRAQFVPFRAASRSGDPGLFTGYYEAGLKGARVADETYRWPLYTRPPDQVSVDLQAFKGGNGRERLIGRVEDGRLVPYFTRAEIDKGALRDRGLELLWVDNPVDAFFLHIQGSGQIKLRDGSTVRVGYAGSNGHRFFAIGRALLDEGLVPPSQGSMQGIRKWLSANPEKADDMMQRNKRYIFFREIDGDGPLGAQGVALTPGRSLAVDPTYMPYGAPIWIDTTWPASKRPLRRLLVAQDTGSAIKGPVRGDFYWGTGEEAAAEAGRMKQSGGYYLLLPKAVAARQGAGS